FYFHYVLRTFASNVILLEDRLGMMIDDIGDIGAGDLLLAVSYEPYARDTVRAVDYAAEAGATVIALTDGAVSPIARHANHVFAVPTAGPSFYQSLIPTIALLEGLISYLATRGGQKMVKRIESEFARRERFGAYWEERKSPERRNGS